MILIDETILIIIFLGCCRQCLGLTCEEGRSVHLFYGRTVIFQPHVSEHQHSTFIGVLLYAVE